MLVLSGLMRMNSINYRNPFWMGIILLTSGILNADRTLAHTLSQSFSSWRVQNESVRVIFTIKISELGGVSKTGDVIPDLSAWLSAYLPTRIAVKSDGKTCQIVNAPSALRVRDGFMRLTWRLKCSPSADIEIMNNAFFESMPSHVHYAQVITEQNPSMQYLFTNTDRRHLIEREGRMPTVTNGIFFGNYVALGIKHILVGLDHIAFLLALLLLCRSMRGLVLMVTGFTVGHSITLTLAILGVVTPNMPVIEALIGFTIALVAAENVGVTAQSTRLIAIIGGIFLLVLGLIKLVGRVGLPPVTLFGLALFTICYLLLSDSQETAMRLRPSLTLLFGLIHGFGFANVLIEINLPAADLIRALFGFNLGVEIGQLVIVTCLGIIGAILTQRLAVLRYRNMVDIASSGLCGLGLFWFIQRAYTV